jgi:hypothetical protein
VPTVALRLANCAVSRSAIWQRICGSYGNLRMVEVAVALVVTTVMPLMTGDVRRGKG